MQRIRFKYKSRVLETRVLAMGPAPPHGQPSSATDEPGRREEQDETDSHNEGP